MVCLTDIKIVYVSKTHRDDKRKKTKKFDTMHSHMNVKKCTS